MGAQSGRHEVSVTHFHRGPWGVARQKHPPVEQRGKQRTGLGTGHSAPASVNAVQIAGSSSPADDSRTGLLASASPASAPSSSPPLHPAQTSATHAAAAHHALRKNEEKLAIRQA